MVRLTQKVIAAVAEANGADTVIMSYGITGKHVAGRVAVKLGASIVPGANALQKVHLLRNQYSLVRLI